MNENLFAAKPESVENLGEKKEAATRLNFEVANLAEMNEGGYDILPRDHMDEFNALRDKLIEIKNNLEICGKELGPDFNRLVNEHSREIYFLNLKKNLIQLKGVLGDAVSDMIDEAAALAGELSKNKPFEL